MKHQWNISEVVIQIIILSLIFLITRRFGKLIVIFAEKTQSGIIIYLYNVSKCVLKKIMVFT